MAPNGTRLSDGRTTSITNTPCLSYQVCEFEPELDRHRRLPLACRFLFETSDMTTTAGWRMVVLLSLSVAPGCARSRRLPARLIRGSGGGGARRVVGHGWRCVSNGAFGNT